MGQFIIASFFMVITVIAYERLVRKHRDDAWTLEQKLAINSSICIGNRNIKEPQPFYNYNTSVNANEVSYLKFKTVGIRKLYLNIIGTDESMRFISSLNNIIYADNNDLFNLDFSTAALLIKEDGAIIISIYDMEDKTNCLGVYKIKFNAVKKKDNVI